MPETGGRRPRPAATNSDAFATEQPLPTETLRGLSGVVSRLATSIADNPGAPLAISDLAAADASRRLTRGAGAPRHRGRAERSTVVVRSDIVGTNDQTSASGNAGAERDNA